MSYLILNETTTPTPPAPSKVTTYAKSDGNIYYMANDGVEHLLAASNAITVLTGDVTATGPGSTVATVASVGGKTSSTIAQSVTDTQNATSANTANTLVKRDGSGNFSAGTITAALVGNATTATTATTAGNVSGIVSITHGGTNLSTTPTDGKLLIGSTAGSNYVLANLTAGTGISIANGSGSISISSTSTSPQVTKTANYTILSTDSIIFCDTSAGAFTLTLPNPAALSGKMYRIIDIAGTFGTNNLTLARSSTEKIEGLAASKVLQTNWGWFNIITNSVDWFVG